MVSTELFEKREELQYNVNKERSEPERKEDEVSVKCCGEECSLYGLKFNGCVANMFDIASMNIVDLRMECGYVGHSDVELMTNKQRRFVLYWWYSTNVYLTCGKNNRIELPQCLVNSIRLLYPNPQGVPYVGHKRKRN